MPAELDIGLSMHADVYLIVPMSKYLWPPDGVERALCILSAAADCCKKASTGES